MESKKINQLATSVSPQTSDLTIIGDPITGVSKKITLLQIANLFATTGTVSSVAVTETGDALTITGSPITSAGTINIGFAGDATQYVRGDGALADFPTSTGGGSSVSYYLNSSVSQGTIGGVAYRQLSKDPIAGAGTDITITADGYIASYLTDANDPALLEVPAGNFNCEFYFSVNSNAHNPYVYAEVYKYDGTNFTLIGSSQSVPEYLTNGTTLSPYYFAIPVTQTALTLTDRIAIRIYANVDTREVTLHTENNHLCQVVTTFSKGLTSLNNLTRQVQFFGTGTSGTDFNISSSTATHTFNLPVASATNTGKLSSTDWSTFNNKQPAGNYVTLDTTQTITAAKTFSLDILVNSLTIGKGAGSIASNTAIGSSALAANTTGTLNTAIGNFSLLSNTTGYGNTSVGHTALGYNTTGFFNAAIGVNALLSNSTGTYNNALGTAALYNNTTGSNNTAVGQQAGTNNTTGSNNTYIGFGSGGGITTGSNNTIIGQFTGTAAMANNIVLADGAANVRYRYDGTNNNLYGNVNFSSTIGNGTYTYTLPSATGTLALTSDLSAYLPLTGGTLTGALSGTSATFSGNVTINAEELIVNKAGGAFITLQTNNTTDTQYIQFKDSGGAAGSIFYNHTNDSLTLKSGGNNSVVLASTGNVGIIATPSEWYTGYTALQVGFSGSIFSNRTSADTNTTMIGNNAFLNSGATNWIYQNNGFATRYTQVSGGHEFYTAASGTAGNAITWGTAKLTIASTGAATFSSTLAVGTTITAQNGGTYAGSAEMAGILRIQGSGGRYFTSGNGLEISFNSIYSYNRGTNAYNDLSINDAMTVKGAGNVGIGTSSPIALLNIYGSTHLQLQNATTGSASTDGTRITLSGSDLQIINRETADTIFYTTDTERMRITSVGQVLIGTSSALQSNEKLGISTDTNTAIMAKFTGGSTNGWAGKFWNNDTTGNNLLVEFLTEASITARGSITYNRGSGVIAYNTTSDYRIKTEISDFNALNILLNLKPIEFRINKAEKKSIGFIAHELQEYLPQAVQGNKDEIDKDGNPIYQSVDYSQLTGLLTKALQESHKLIKDLEGRIVTLESKLN